jgi:hypothetical protein
MFLKSKIATGAVAGVLTLAMTGASALAAFQPAQTPASATVHVADTETNAAERGKNTGHIRALEAILGRLVANGTITAEQKAQILEAVNSAGDAEDGARHLKRIWNTFMGFSVEYLGLEKDDVNVALREGTSLGALADTTEGKSREELILFIVVEVTTLIDQAVADEEITDERATAAKAGLAEKVTRFVDHVYEKRVAKDRAKELKERAKELKERAKERAKEQKERTKERRAERKAERGEEQDQDD